MLRSLAIVLLTAAALPAALSAHPVPGGDYDRIVTVRLRPVPNTKEVQLQVDYRLEVDAETIVIKDMAPYRKEIDLSKIVRRIDYFAEYTRIFATIFAGNLYAEFNGKHVQLTCVGRHQTFEDETGKPLDHLRCDFQFQARVVPVAGQTNQVVFREMNFTEQPGKIVLSLANELSYPVVLKEVPDPAMQGKPFSERTAKDESRLRGLRLHFKVDDEPAVAIKTETPPVEPAPEAREPSLLRLFLGSDAGMFVLLLMAAGIGAVHALTPGHGKTMVAAYLVGQRGTLWHAVVLGLVTTLTHTGIVLFLAGALLFLPEGMSADMQGTIQTGLGLTMGLAIVCLGLYLLLLRLSGRADHIHLGGGHHHHQPASPGALAPGVMPPPDQAVGWWGLIVLGISGGLIPCWDAIALLVLSVSMNLFWLALPVLLAFSAGLAAVLVLVGVLVVKARNLLGERWGEGRFVRALPIFSAIVVTAMGFWVCYEAVHQ